MHLMKEKDIIRCDECGARTFVWFIHIEHLLKHYLLLCEDCKERLRRLLNVDYDGRYKQNSSVAIDKWRRRANAEFSKRKKLG
jgi:predicted nucleic acid-binding Zn ribbon protein